MLAARALLEAEIAQPLEESIVLSMINTNNGNLKVFLKAKAACTN